MTDAAVETAGLSRTFGDLVAVDGVTLTVRAGEVFGLVGPDGAGKSTLLKVLATILRPTAGRGRVLGFDLVEGRDEIRARAAFTSEEFTLYGDLTVEENLEFFGRVFGLKGAAFERKKRRLLEFSRLEPFLRRRAEQLSGGMKQKLAISCALIREPELILLDEPTRGVDPLSRRELWRILGEVNAEGVTLVVSTPYLDEAERCDRIAFMSGGRVVFVDEPKRVVERFPYAVFEAPSDRPMRDLEAVRAIAGVVSAAVAGRAVRVVAEPGAAGSVAAAIAAAVGTDPRRVAADLDTVLLVASREASVAAGGGDA